jgi:hypothetical protein
LQRRNNEADVMRTFVGSIPPRIELLHKDKRGYPVPYFVAWIEGEPKFQIVDGDKMKDCMRNGRCWICGQRMGAYKSFVIGPMCVINRLSAEPPSHLDCSRFAALNCPFLAHPMAKRVKVEGEFSKPGGVMIERNPGVTAVWTTKGFTIEKDMGKPLWRIGSAERVEFYANGRKARQSEVDASVQSGIPLLRSVASREGALPVLERQITAFHTMMRELIELGTTFEPEAA